MSLTLPSLSELLSVTQAIFTGERVPDKVIEARLAACKKCEFIRRDNKYFFCGLCRCQVSSPKTRLVNLAAYVENLPKWGCKHPGRRFGLGWPKFRQGEKDAGHTSGQ